MIYPDVRTFHEDRWQSPMTPLARRPHFLGRNALDVQWESTRPVANIQRHEKLFELEIPMPGFTKEEITVSVFEDILTIRAEREKQEAVASKYVLREFNADVLQRQFKLADGIGEEEITAEFVNGMLKVIVVDVPEDEEQVYPHKVAVN